MTSDSRHYIEFHRYSLCWKHKALVVIAQLLRDTCSLKSRLKVGPRGRTEPRHCNSSTGYCSRCNCSLEEYLSIGYLLSRLSLSPIQNKHNRYLTKEYCSRNLSHRMNCKWECFPQGSYISRLSCSCSRSHFVSHKVGHILYCIQNKVGNRSLVGTRWIDMTLGWSRRHYSWSPY